MTAMTIHHKAACWKHSFNVVPLKFPWLHLQVILTFRSYSYKVQISISKRLTWNKHILHLSCVSILIVEIWLTYCKHTPLKFLKLYALLLHGLFDIELNEDWPVLNSCKTYALCRTEYSRTSTELRRLVQCYMWHYV